MSEPCSDLGFCELLCHRFIVALCFETGPAAAAPSCVLFGAKKKRRVIVGHFECSSFVAVCPRMR